MFKKPSSIHKHIFLFLFLIGFVIYGNGLVNDFVLDDKIQILGNPQVHSINNIHQLFTGGTFFDGSSNSRGNYYRPIMSSAYTLLYTVFGPTPFAFHLLQLLLHIINAWFVFRLFKKFLKPQLSILGSLFFLLHPINSATVFYIANLQDTLFMFFGLSALLLVTSKSYFKHKLLIVFSLLFLSLLSKETGALFILMVLVYAWVYKKELIMKSLLMSSILVIVYLFLKYTIAHINSSVDPFAPIVRLSLHERLLHIPLIITYYLKTFFYPINLVAIQNWIISAITIKTFYMPLAVSLFTIIAIVISLISLKKGETKKQFFFFTAWFISGLVIHLQIHPLDSTVADHWFYFPIVGFLGMLLSLVEKINLQKKAHQNIALLICIIVLTLLAYRSFIRSFDWRNEYTLATHDLKVDPNNFVLENTLANNLLKKNDTKGAEKHFNKAREIDPGNNMAWHNLGYIYEQKGIKENNKAFYQKSENYYEQAIKTGNDVTSYINLARLKLFEKQDTDYQSINSFLESTLVKFPNNPQLVFMHAITLYKLNDKFGALSEMRQLLESDPSNPHYIQVYQLITSDKPLELAP